MPVSDPAGTVFWPVLPPSQRLGEYRGGHSVPGEPLCIAPSRLTAGQPANRLWWSDPLPQARCPRAPGERPTWLKLERMAYPQCGFSGQKGFGSKPGGFVLKILALKNRQIIVIFRDKIPTPLRHPGFCPGKINPSGDKMVEGGPPCAKACGAGKRYALGRLCGLLLCLEGCWGSLRLGSNPALNDPGADRLI